MEKQTFHLVSDATRRNAAQAVINALEQMICEIKPRTRSLDANAKMWAMLADISKQAEWPLNGVTQKLSPEDWKDILSASLSQETVLLKAFVAALPCLSCGVQRRSQAAHLNFVALGKGMGIKLFDAL